MLGEEIQLKAVACDVARLPRPTASKAASGRHLGYLELEGRGLFRFDHVDDPKRSETTAKPDEPS